MSGYGLPTEGQLDWADLVNDSIEYVKTTAEDAAATAATAGSAASTAQSQAGGAAQKASNLADLASASSARTNLGLGSAATSGAGDFDTSGSAATVQAYAVQRVNHTGTQSADTITDGATNKAYTATEKTKLAGIASLATANSSDATLLARANHTGTQAISTIAGLLTQSSTASGATLTPTGDASRNEFFVTALATAPTIAAPSGTPANGNSLLIRIKDNGTGRALTWNATYRVIGVTLPTTTTANKTLYVGARYNSTDSKWDVLAVGVEA